MSLITQTNTYTTPGTYTYTIPQGVSALEFYLWGAGGAGGSSGEVISKQTGTEIVGQELVGTRPIGQVEVGIEQTGTRVAGSVVLQEGVAAARVAVSKELVVPPGVTAVSLTVVGGGGGGGGSDGGDKDHNIYGRGGQAGQLAKTTIAVQPGQVISTQIGSGGAGGGTAGSGGSGQPTFVFTNGAAVVSAAGGGGGDGRAVGGARQYGVDTPIGAGSGGDGSPNGYGSAGLAGSSGAVIVEWSAVPEVRQDIIEAVFTPIFETQYVPVYQPVIAPVFTSYPGGSGAGGGAGGYANRKIRVTQGDVVVVSVGGAGVGYVGGTGVYPGGSAGAASGAGRGGGGGAATVVTVNGTIVAVAAGGGGGGGGGTNGATGTAGTGAEISGGTGGASAGANSASGPSTGGGGGGGYFGGTAGGSGNGGGGGRGGVSYGTIIQAGTTAPGGLSVSLYPSARPGYPGRSGAAILTFTKSFNINVKQTNNWKSVDRAWVKVNGVWKELLNGWTKVSGTWQPLITARSIEGAENLAAPTIVYTLTPDVISVDEGDTVTFTLGGTGLTNGTVVPYTATGIDAEAVVGALSGNFVVGTTDSITFTPKLNQTTYGSRTIKVFLDNKGINASCVVNNISLTPVYSLAPNISFVNEGGTVTFTLTTANVDSGEVIPYSVSGITAADLTAGSLTGNFIVGTTETATFTVRSDSLTEGTESINISLHSRPGSASCQIIDTSTNPPVPFTGSRTLSGNGSWTVPDYVTSLSVTVTGGGGGGGGNHSTSCSVNTHRGGNGGGGYTNSDTFSVSPGQQFSFSAGVGGAGGAAKEAGATGGTSSFGSVVAAGGGGGGGGKAGAPGVGGSGGNGGAGGVFTDALGKQGGSGSISLSWSGSRPG
jgi:hypothetical protein